MSRRNRRFGLWLIFLACVWVLAVWSMPIRFLLAHVSRGGALWLVLVVGTGISLLAAALNDRLTPRHKTHQRRISSDVFITIGLGVFFSWLLYAEIIDFAYRHFTQVYTPTNRLSSVFVYTICCCALLAQGLLRWLAQRRTDGSAAADR